MTEIKLNEASLKTLRLPELQQKYAEIVGASTRCPNKAWLVGRILEAAKTRATSAKEQSAPRAGMMTKTMTVEELQACHLELIGRPTGSRDVAYLRWRLRQAERGLIRIGIEPRVPHRADDMVVLPVRMPSRVVARMDEARRRLGLASRAELFRRALHRYFFDFDEREVAAFLIRGDGGTGVGAVPISEARS